MLFLFLLFALLSFVDIYYCCSLVHVLSLKLTTRLLNITSWAWTTKSWMLLFLLQPIVLTSVYSSHNCYHSMHVPVFTRTFTADG